MSVYIITTIFSKFFGQCNISLISCIDVVREQSKATQGTPCTTSLISGRGKRYLDKCRGMLLMAFLYMIN